MKGQTQFGKKGKLAPRHIGPFEVLKKISLVAYWIALPSEMEQVYNVFHISILRGYAWGPSHVIDYQRLVIDEDLEYEERLIQIIDHQVKQLKNKAIPMVKLEEV
ncbi:uncharacterized protein LOC114306936 [Camellia sinensis]|uniref:uncharacterized protein LOC114306936 n=1 Tax=Camellia sinensis TaxID=4442 RepID=UPI001035DA97|nr:uncharacterized protein LOC114306936 [Camellia sinensis]